MGKSKHHPNNLIGRLHVSLLRERLFTPVTVDKFFVVMSSHADSMMERFKGALIGAVVGDCLGARFEGRFFRSAIPIEVVCKLVDDAKCFGMINNLKCAKCLKIVSFSCPLIFYVHLPSPYSYDCLTCAVLLRW
jgi:hypothetical protein